MRKLFTCFCGIFIICSSLKAQWNVSLYTNSEMFAMDALPGGKVFVGGSNNEYISDNYGANFTTYSFNPTSSLGPFFAAAMQDVHFESNSIGWGIVTEIYRETIAKSTDGGQNWNAVFDTISDSLFANLTSICKPGASVLYAAGNYGHVYKTSDNGLTWAPVYFDGSYNFNSIYFANPDTGYAVGDSAYIFTTNGGLSWTTMRVNDLIYAVFFPCDTVAYACSQNGLLYKLDMSGNFTTYIPSIASTNRWALYGLYFTSVDTGYVAATNRVYKTTDGGQNWEEGNDIMDQFPLNRIKFVNAQNGIMISDDNIYITNNIGGIYKPAIDVINLPGTTKFCQYTTDTFSVTGSPLWNYKWYLNDTLIGDSARLIYTFTTAGNKTLMAIITYGAGRDTVSTTVSIQAPPVLPQFTVKLTKDTVCWGASTYYFFVKLNQYTNNAYYEVYQNDSSVYTGYSGPFSFSLPYPYFTHPDTFKVYGEVMGDACGNLIDSASAVLTLHPYPGEPNFQLVNDTVCIGDSVVFKLWPSAMNYQYRLGIGLFQAIDSSVYYPGNGGTITGEISTSGWGPLTANGLTNEVVTMTSIDGCTYNFIKYDSSLYFDSITSVFSTAYVNYLYTDSVQLINQSMGTHWHWTGWPDIAFSDSLSAQPYAFSSAFSGTETIQLITVTDYGCTATSSQQVFIHYPTPELEVNRCYESAMNTAGTDSDFRIVVDDHLDRFGSLYVSGYYYYESYYTFYGYARYHMFVEKFDSAGNLLWEKKLLYGYGNSPDSAVYTIIPGSYNYLYSCATGITTDEDDNVYICGNYTGEFMKIDNITSYMFPGGSMQREGFIAKLDKNGKCQWIITTTNTNYDSPFEVNDIGHFSDIEYWGNGKLLVAGKNVSSAIFKNDSATFSGLIMIDTAGNYIKDFPLADNFPGHNYNNSANSDNNSDDNAEYYCYYPKIKTQGYDMYLYGVFNGMNNGTDTLVSNLDNSVGYFVGELNPSGWIALRQLESSSNQRYRAEFLPNFENNYFVHSFAMDDSLNYYVVVSTLNSVQWGQFVATYFSPDIYDTATSPCFYVAKFSNDGNMIWYKRLPPFNNSGNFNLAQLIFTQSNLYLYSFFYDNFSGIFSNNGISYSFHNIGYPIGNYDNDGLTKIDPSGNVLSSRSLGVDISASLITADLCSGSFYLLGSTLTDSLAPSYNYYETLTDKAFKFSLNANCSEGVCLLPLYVQDGSAASCSDTLSINYTSLIYDPNASGISIISASAGHGSVTWDSASFYYKGQNSLIQADTITFIACNGNSYCDTALVFLRWSSSGPVTVSQSGDTLFAGTGTNPVWLNCLTEAAVGQSAYYVPHVTGSYAFIDGTVSCRDTSQCYGIIINGEPNVPVINFSLSPDPFTQSLEIRTNVDGLYNLRIYDVEGNAVFEKSSAAPDLVLDLSNLSSGVYFLEMKSANQRFIRKVVKI